MTQEVKKEIRNVLNEKLCNILFESEIIILAAKIEKIVDDATGKAILETCELGELLESFGLEITAKKKEER